MSGISRSQKIRIAIGLSALKFKPPEQSVEAYLLDLQTSFTAPCSRQSLQENAWRKRALELEDALGKIKAASEAEHIELISLRATSALDNEPSEEPPAKKKKTKKGAASTAQSTPSLRATKAPIPPLQPRVDLPHIVDEKTIPVPARNSLFPALYALQALSTTISGNPSSQPPPALIISTSHRCTAALSSLLSVLTAPPASDRPIPAPTHICAALASTIPHMLLTLVPPLLSAYRISGRSAKTHFGSAWTASDPMLNFAQPACDTMRDALDAFLGPLASSVLVPLVKSFRPLVEARAMALLAPPSTSARSDTSSKTTGLSSVASKPRRAEQDLVDPSDLVHVLQCTLETLHHLCDEALAGDLSAKNTARADALAGCVQALEERVALEVVRELDGLFPLAPCPDDGATLCGSSSSSAGSSTLSTTSAGSSTDPPAHVDPRIRRLARRQTLHYLCTALSLCLSPSAGAHTSSVVRELLGGRLAAVLRGRMGGGKSGGGGEMQEVEEGMVLSVIERAWAVGVCGPLVVEDEGCDSGGRDS